MEVLRGSGSRDDGCRCESCRFHQLPYGSIHHHARAGSSVSKPAISLPGRLPPHTGAIAPGSLKGKAVRLRTMRVQIPQPAPSSCGNISLAAISRGRMGRFSCLLEAVHGRPAALEGVKAGLCRHSSKVERMRMRHQDAGAGPAAGTTSQEGR